MREAKFSAALLLSLISSVQAQSTHVITINIPYCPIYSSSLASYSTILPGYSSSYSSMSQRPTLASSSSGSTPQPTSGAYDLRANSGLSGCNVVANSAQSGGSAADLDTCLEMCNVTPQCLAVTYFGSTCILYSTVRNTMTLLNGTSGFNRQRFSGFSSDSDCPPRFSSTSSTPSSSMSSIPGTMSTRMSTRMSMSMSMSISVSTFASSSRASSTPALQSSGSISLSSSFALVSPPSSSSSSGAGTVSAPGYSSTTSLPSSVISSVSSGISSTMSSRISSTSSTSTPAAEPYPSSAPRILVVIVDPPVSVASSSGFNSAGSSASSSPISSASSSAISSPISSASPSSSSSALSPSSSSTTPAPTPTPTRSFGKRGLAYTNASYTLPFSLEGQNSFVSWGYNWYNSRFTPDNNATNPVIQFIPMLFSDAPDLMAMWPAAAQAAIADGATALMSFNEPDVCYGGSACMPNITKAVAAHKRAMEPFYGRNISIGAPAVSDNGAEGTGLSYLSWFMGNCTGCQIDYVNIHFYNNVYAFSYLQYYVLRVHELFGLPIWITEIGIDSSGGTDAQRQAYLQQVIPWMDAVPFVERYVWFLDAPGYLINENGEGLSAQGMIYNSFTAPCPNWNNTEAKCTWD